MRVLSREAFRLRVIPRGRSFGHKTGYSITHKPVII